MQLNKEKALSKVLNSYGYRSKEFSEEDANDIIAKEFQERANSFLNHSDFTGKTLVTLRFVERMEAKYSETATAATGFDAMVIPMPYKRVDCYAIIVSMNMLRGITSLFAAASIGAEATIRGITEEDIVNNFDKIYPLILSGLSFIFFHEYAHILRAHLPFYYDELLKNSRHISRMSFHLIESNTTKNTSKIRLHRAMEIDADLIALGLMIVFLSDKSIDKTHFFSSELRSQPETVGESVYFLMRLLELWRRVISKETYSKVAMHPHPDIRHAFIEAWLLKRNEGEFTTQFYNTMNLFKAGTDSAIEKIRKFGSTFLPNWEYLSTQGSAAWGDEYERLRLDWEGYLKPALKKYRNRI